jgi:hypothetical protein
MRYSFHRIGNAFLREYSAGGSTRFTGTDLEGEMIALTKGAEVSKRQMAVLIIGILILSSGAAFLHAQQGAPADPKQLVRSVIDNELNETHHEQGRWMYRLQKQEGDKSTVKEVVETRDCEIHLLLSTNGEPLTPDQRQKENERLQKLVNDPEQMRKAKRDQEEDDRKAVEMFKMLPEAFIYRYSGNQGSLVELTFSPNPDFHSHSREAQVFHGMEGTMLVNPGKKRLVEIDGKLAQDIEFVGGLFGHLDKGGHFTVKRAELAPGQWVMTLLTVEMKGKALIFKSINLQEKDWLSDFRPVPADLNPIQAADLLRNSGFAEVASGPAAQENSGRSVQR